MGREQTTRPLSMVEVIQNIEISTHDIPAELVQEEAPEPFAKSMPKIVTDQELSLEAAKPRVKSRRDFVGLNIFDGLHDAAGDKIPVSHKERGQRKHKARLVGVLVVGGLAAAGLFISQDNDAKNSQATPPVYTSAPATTIPARVVETTLPVVTTEASVATTVTPTSIVPETTIPEPTTVAETVAPIVETTVPIVLEEASMPDVPDEPIIEEAIVPNTIVTENNVVIDCGAPTFTIMTGWWAARVASRCNIPLGDVLANNPGHTLESLGAVPTGTVIGLNQPVAPVSPSAEIQQKTTPACVTTELPPDFSSPIAYLRDDRGFTEEESLHITTQTDFLQVTGIATHGYAGGQVCIQSNGTIRSKYL